jgi:hypothetical protein
LYIDDIYGGANDSAAGLVCDCAENAAGITLRE